MCLALIVPKPEGFFKGSVRLEAQKGLNVNEGLASSTKNVQSSPSSIPNSIASSRHQKYDPVD